jgi:hypothetical protein
MRVLTSRVRRFGENRSPISRGGVKLTPGMASPTHKFVAAGTLVATVVSGGGGCVSWVVFGAVVVVPCRNRPVTTDPPSRVRMIKWRAGSAAGGRN